MMILNLIAADMGGQKVFHSIKSSFMADRLPCADSLQNTVQDMRIILRICAV